MENSFRKSSISSAPRSIAGDHESRVSEISVNSITANLRRLFDFSQTKLPGLYQVTSKYFILEYCESDSIAYTKFHTKPSSFSAIFKEEALVMNGIQYCGFIKIKGSNNSVKIFIPAYRSYDPAGVMNAQYLNSKQFLLMVKLISAEIRAATCGVREKRLEKIKKCFESVTALPSSMKFLWNWVHLQVKLACYKNIQPPKYFEYLLNKLLTDDFHLDSRDDCKEYLEKCLRGGEVKLPLAYYKSVLCRERKLPFEMKVFYSECENRENKEEKAENCALVRLPKMVQGLTCVREGKNIGKLLNDCERLHKLYETNVHQNKCKVM